MLSNQYIWTTGNNPKSWPTTTPRVVICFQISIFELLETTIFQTLHLSTGCDLLSNQYIWTTGNNCVNQFKAVDTVVICFQISIFELLETTHMIGISCPILLWFAFKSVYLNYWKQLWEEVIAPERCCDLLSNQYIWTTGNNGLSRSAQEIQVVICFQISIFELLETTINHILICRLKLWFAFKSVYLNYWKQQTYAPHTFPGGCDLLSNQYIWTTGNNCKGFHVG